MRTDQCHLIKEQRILLLTLQQKWLEVAHHHAGSSGLLGTRGTISPPRSPTPPALCSTGYRLFLDARCWQSMSLPVRRRLILDQKKPTSSCMPDHISGVVQGLEVVQHILSGHSRFGVRRTRPVEHRSVPSRTSAPRTLRAASWIRSHVWRMGTRK
jgi:hypothetical protein